MKKLNNRGLVQFKCINNIYDKVYKKIKSIKMVQRVKKEFLEISIIQRSVPMRDIRYLMQVKMKFIQ